MSERRTPISMNVLVAIAIAGILLAACGGGGNGNGNRNDNGMILPPPRTSVATVTFTNRCFRGNIRWQLVAFPSEFRDSLYRWGGAPGYWQTAFPGQSFPSWRVTCREGETVCIGVEALYSRGLWWGVGVNRGVDAERDCAAAGDRWRFICTREDGPVPLNFAC